MKKKIFILFVAVLAFASCDDGHVDEKQYIDESEKYNAVVSGVFDGIDTWSSEYNIVIAGFNEESEYAVIQKTIPNASPSETPMNIELSNISTECKTIEICAVNALRAKIVSFYTFNIPDTQRSDDIIRIDAGKIDVRMYSAINSAVFNDDFFSCSRCHGGSQPTANLDLSSENSYANLVGVQSTCNPDAKRVVPGDADNSVLYQAITNGAGIRYSHPSLFSEDKRARMVSFVKAWIDNGAAE